MVFMLKCTIACAAISDYAESAHAPALWMTPLLSKGQTQLIANALVLCD